METTVKTRISIDAEIQAPVETVWNLLTNPMHIVHWNNASDDWYCPRAENDLRVGGKLTSRMESRDGTQGFDFSGTYTRIVPFHLIEYTLDDGRKVRISLDSDEHQTRLTETFDAEQINPPELQKEGWQAILNNFKKYVENSLNKERLHFEIGIRATPEKVYHILISKEGYSGWTAEFNPTSRFEGSWEKGSSIRFVGTDQDGTQGGMAAKIRENIPNRFISIEYYAVIKKGQVITTGPETEAWSGGLENYFLVRQGDHTQLYVDVDANQQYRNYFLETWPKALNKLKAMSESE